MIALADLFVEMEQTLRVVGRTGQPAGQLAGTSNGSLAAAPSLALC